MTAIDMRIAHAGGVEQLVMDSTPMDYARATDKTALAADLEAEDWQTYLREKMEAEIATTGAKMAKMNNPDTPMSQKEIEREAARLIVLYCQYTLREAQEELAMAEQIYAEMKE
ncbi:hypothetical protein FACS189487_05600 [Campylobacterota bacterium]|nr:hypothetical protein FACS189487_05600 [Campylobacterota bacterium]